MKIRCAHDELVPIETLKSKFNHENRNIHPQEQIDRLSEILKYQGARYPVKISKQSGFITSGHGRVLAAEQAGWASYPVNYQDYDDGDQEYADTIADNSIASWAELDLSGINSDIGDLGPDFDLDLLGIKDFVIEPADKYTGCDEDEIPEKVEPKTCLGDIYQLGIHRLMCGDSTAIDQVEKLMNREKAYVVVTSPPYADQREYGIGDFNWDQLMLPVFDNLTFVSRPETHILINLGPSHKDRKVNFYWNNWLNHTETIGWPLFGLYVWDKGSGFPGHHQGRLGPSHEYIFHFNLKSEQANKWIETTGESKKRRGSGEMRFRQKDGSMKAMNNPETIGQYFKIPDSVIRITREISRGIHTQNHPAVYPVEFAEFLIRTWSNESQCILEPFGGSGSTLIACEKTNRRCFMMEINPYYCDVIVARWEKYTGKKAELLNG